MLYYFLNFIEKLYHPPGFGVVRYLTFRSAAAAVTALVISFWIGPKIIELLRRYQIGEAAKVEAPKTHLSKAGTPTMGGLIVLGSVLIPTLLWGDLRNMYVVLIIFVTTGLGIVGFLDDYLKVVKKKPKGLIGWYKIVGQVTVGFVLGAALYFSPELKLIGANTITTVPFFKNLNFDFVFMYIPVVIFIIVATSNAVNLTDGLDGLAIGTVGIVALTLAVISYISGNIEFSRYLNIIYLRGNGELVIYCAALVGAALGFLWFNSFPAQVFMGDTGSLALGGSLGIISILIHQPLLLMIAGGVFVLEASSVLLQTGWYKYTRRRTGTGRRIFRMAPLHHHFEKMGWYESQVVTRFYILGVLCAVVALSTLKIR